MSAGDAPPPDRPSTNATDDESLLTRFRTAETGPLMFVRELLTSMATVAAVGLLLFAISGVWPPMVAVESGSMDPHMQKGDLIFVTEPGRYMPDYAHGETGVVTYRVGEQADYRTFGSYGSVVVYKNPSTFGPPIIHRAMFWVDEGENWYDEANKSYINAGSCAELRNCPAPHSGFVTKGDNNPYYDQANGISSPVKPDWLVGTARLRIPYLGWIRLGFSGAATAIPVGPGVASGASTPMGAALSTTSAPGAPVSAVGIPAASLPSNEPGPEQDSMGSTPMVGPSSPEPPGLSAVVPERHSASSGLVGDYGDLSGQATVDPGHGTETPPVALAGVSVVV
jgi:signal peptidase